MRLIRLLDISNYLYTQRPEWNHCQTFTDRESNGARHNWLNLDECERKNIFTNVFGSPSLDNVKNTCPSICYPTPC